jgi:hypothetical protein
MYHDKIENERLMNLSNESKVLESAKRVVINEEFDRLKTIQQQPKRSSWFEHRNKNNQDTRNFIKKYFKKKTTDDENRYRKRDKLKNLF